MKVTHEFLIKRTKVLHLAWLHFLCPVWKTKTNKNKTLYHLISFSALKISSCHWHHITGTFLFYLLIFCFVFVFSPLILSTLQLPAHPQKGRNKIWGFISKFLFPGTKHCLLKHFIYSHGVRFYLGVSSSIIFSLCSYLLVFYLFHPGIRSKQLQQPDICLRTLHGTVYLCKEFLALSSS